MVDSWTTYVVQGRTCNCSIYSVEIYQGLFVEFSYDSYETLCNIRLLSALLTVLVSGFHNRKSAIPYTLISSHTY